MAIYHYVAIDAKGSRQAGNLDATNEREAREKLRDLGLMACKLIPKKEGSSKERLKGDNLHAFTLQLSQLVGAGIPIYESLLALEELYRKEPFHHIISSICEQIKCGKSFSEAISSFPSSFNKLYCAMIQAGEAVGSLHLVLDKLVFLLSKQLKLQKEMTNALIYPAILATFAFVVIMVLLGFVVPSIEGIFAERELNRFTSFVLGVSHIFRNYWWIYLPFIFGTAGYAFWKLKTKEGKLWLQRQLLNVPILRNLIIEAAVARFSRTMGTLQLGGLTMIDSLRIATGVINNIALEEEMHAAEIKVIEGKTLSSQFARSAYFPHMATRMLAIGEDSGNTGVMLNKIADMYEENLEKTLGRVLALVQPIILVTMGAVIGLVMIAILLPLTDIATLTM